MPDRADLERRTVELLQRLIRFQTVNPPGDEAEAQEWLRGLLEGAGFECELLAEVPGRPNLVARLRSGVDGPALCLLGHVDTVLAEPSEWRVDPWSAELRDGFVWGRGAVDMKSQIAAELAAVLTLTEEGWRPEAGELIVVFTADEETGALHGAQWLCREHPERVRCGPGRQRGRRRDRRLRRAARLHGLCRREGRLPLHRHRRGAGRPRVAAAAGRQRARQARAAC